MGIKGNLSLLGFILPDNELCKSYQISPNMNEIFFAEVELGLAQGVYLFLGYSKKDEELLKKVTEQGAMEAIGAIQGLVSYHNVNSNKVRSNMTSFILIFCLIVNINRIK